MIDQGEIVGTRPKTRSQASMRADSEAKETKRYETLKGILACLIADFNLSGIRTTSDHLSLFNVHQS